MVIFEVCGMSVAFLPINDVLLLYLFFPRGDCGGTGCRHVVQYASSARRG